MKEKVINFLKPTLGKVVLTLGFLGWQYFYSYQNVRLEFLSIYGEYITKALAAFNWGNYFVKNFSLFMVWILIALLLFFAVWLFETIITKVHNFRVERKYVNQPESDYQHLLKENIGFAKRLYSHSFWFAGIIITLISLFALSDLFERLRFSILDNLSWNAYIAGSAVDFTDPNYVIGSFVALSLIWYLIASFIVWVFDEQRVKDSDEKITKEHFAVKVDTENAPK